MRIPTVFRSLNSNARRRRLTRRNSPTSRLRLESLEDRRTPSFSPAATYAVGANPQALVVADVNGDSRPDIAVVNTSSSDVSVLLGNADGTFQAAQTSSTGSTPLSVAVGDFNDDGRLDLATANAGDVSLLLGNGDGTFQPPTSIGVGSSPASVAVGDFNADGKLDLGVTSNVYYPGYYGYYGWYPGWYVGHANVLLGNGDGTFSTSNSTSLGYGMSSSAVVADFNGDGKQDFAAANSAGNIVSVLLGDGAGALAAPTYLGTGSYPQSLTATDVNGDGKIDLMTANAFGNSITVLLGNDLGSFAAAQNYVAGSAPRSVAAADFNGDGKIDLATANGDAGTLSVLLGTGSGAFRPPVSAVTGASAAGVAVGDFNGDGRPDAASANSSSNNASALLNDGIWPALDAPFVTIGDFTTIEGNAGTTEAAFTVSLSAAYGQSVSIHYATTDGSATAAGNDFQTTSGTLTFDPGVTSQTVIVPINGDRLPESSEFFNVRLSDPINAFVTDALGVGTITDDEPTLSIGNYSAMEGNTGTTAFNFTVTLSAAYDAPVTVDYATADLTTDEQYYYGAGATAGVDYTATSGTLTFPAGETSQIITVPVTGDRLGEGVELFWVNLSNLTSAHGGGRAAGTILNDEPFLSIDYANGVEGNTGTTALTFTVNLSAASDAPVTVDYATADGSATLAGGDYQSKLGTLTFAPGETSQTFAVLVNGDRRGEYDEYFFVNLTNATGALISNATNFGSIQDDEPRVNIDDSSIVEGNRGTKVMRFAVTLSAIYDQPVTVNYVTVDGCAGAADGDYRSKSGTLTFARGQTSKTINVLVNGDRIAEDDEDFYVNLTGASGALVNGDWGYGTIEDNEPHLRIHDSTLVESNAGRKVMKFTVTLSKAYDQAVTVNFATRDDTATAAGNDYVVKSGKVTFAPGQTTKTITVVIRGDNEFEDDEEFRVILSSASSNALITRKNGWGTIENDDLEL